MKGLHIGCGPVYIDNDDKMEWINTDIRNSFRTDLCYNALHLDDKIDKESIDVIWCCHMLEHLDYPTHAIQFLTVCFTLLKKGGIIRLVVPDLELISGYYLNKDEKLMKIYANGKFFYMFDNFGERFNYFLKEWEHKIVYDTNMLCDIFKSIGFESFGKKGFRESIIPGWSHDRLEGESLYFEGIK